ncbi:MAG: hypothetical protein AAGI03_12605, partial [Pseudomonadota bacterium]
VETLGFLSVEGLYKAIGGLERNGDHPQFADHCFTGDYPTRLLDRDRQQGDKNFQLSLLDEPSLRAVG